MIKYIKYHPQFEKQCEKLKKSNDMAGKAVENAWSIISSFKESREDFHNMGTLTHFGELRLKDGIKYKLGSGYRLVLSVSKYCLFVLCIGTHDQCDLWLEKNRGRDDFIFSWQEKAVQKKSEKRKSQKSIEYNRQSDFFTPIDDRVLRQVFKGICNSIR
jgi:mRNA-degrading endonuclease RelE of RelBE toxin-antitoxin system